MVEKIFWKDAYCVQLETRVARTDHHCVWLEATNFFAASGGQESDSGSIGGWPVLAADKDGLNIVYSLPAEHTLVAGDPALICIDWARRYRLMRLHFAAEMVLQLVYRFRPGIQRIGAHISEQRARVDFSSGENISTLFGMIGGEVVALVNADLPIVTDYEDPVLQRRYWEVDGFARMACGGTHPRSTGEIGRITLKRRNTGKGKERIEIGLECDSSAYPESNKLV